MDSTRLWMAALFGVAIGLMIIIAIAQFVRLAWPVFVEEWHAFLRLFCGVEGDQDG